MTPNKRTELAIEFKHTGVRLTLVIPRPAQRVLFPVIILSVAVLGKYHGTTWPGCPARCNGTSSSSGGATPDDELESRWDSFNPALPDEKLRFLRRQAAKQ